MIIFFAFLVTFALQIIAMENESPIDPIQEFVSQFNIKAIQEIEYISIRKACYEKKIKYLEKTKPAHVTPKVDNDSANNLAEFFASLTQNSKKEFIKIDIPEKPLVPSDYSNIHWIEAQHSFICLDCNKLFIVDLWEISLERAFNEAINHNCKES